MFIRFKLKFNNIDIWEVMKSNNKVTRGKTIDKLFRKSWALLSNASRMLTEFLVIRQLNNLKQA